MGSDSPGDIATLQQRLNMWKAPQIDLDAFRDAELGVRVGKEVVDRLEDMAGNYLNAARVGVDDLERSHASAGGERWAPENRCTTCPSRQVCHATFGHVPGPDAEPLGIFPFTREALATAQERLQGEEGVGSLVDGLNARLLIKGVLEPVLDLAGGPGRPPTRDIAIRLRVLPAEMDEMAGQIRTATGMPFDDAADAAGAAAIWGVPVDDQPTTVEVPLAVARALALPEAPPVRHASATRTRPPTRDTAVIAPQSDDEGKLVTAVREWRSGAPLKQEQGRDLRGAVHRVLVQGVDIQGIAGAMPAAKGTAAELGLAQAESSIRLEDALVGERQASANAVALAFTRADAPFLAAVAAVGKDWSVERVDDLVALAEGVDACSRELVEVSEFVDRPRPDRTSRSPWTARSCHVSCRWPRHRGHWGRALTAGGAACADAGVQRWPRRNR